MEDGSSEKEKVTNFETMEHINSVRYFMSKIIKELVDRMNEHDQSKLESPEVEMFAQYTDKLSGSTYGSKEYNEFLSDLKPALDHHYANNRHHPEHFENGINDMSLVDLVELLCDWKSSSMRHTNGNIRKSLEINKKRFSVSDQLNDVLKNTVDFIDM
jgi:hypothetical protein